MHCLFVLSCAQHGRTPLMEAAIDNNASLVKLLIKAGADIDAVDPVSKRCASESV